MCGWWSHDWIIYLNGFDWQRMWLDISSLCLLSSSGNLTGQKAAYWVKIKCVWLRLGQMQCSHEVKVQFLGRELREGQYAFKRSEVKWSFLLSNGRILLLLKQSHICFDTMLNSESSLVFSFCLWNCARDITNWNGFKMHAINNCTVLKYRDYGVYANYI